MSSPLRASAFSATILALGLGPAVSLAHAQSTAPSPASLTTAQIVEQMIRRNEAQKEGLKEYKALRHYHVEYRGFTKDIQAAMDVEVDYDADKGKSFKIISESGSGLLRDDVLKRAVNSEEDAMKEIATTALTEANYRFHLEGTDSPAARPAYILSVEPITPSKFLYRGKIWVDAADFAVVKMETQPAKSPSFWISQTQIHYTGAKTNGFWLPGQVVSVTRVRVGGTAVLTIDYGSYAIVPETVARVRDTNGVEVAAK